MQRDFTSEVNLHIPTLKPNLPEIKNRPRILLADKSEKNPPARAIDKDIDKKCNYLYTTIYC